MSASKPPRRGQTARDLMKDGTLGMTMNADVNAQPGPVGQSWCAGLVRSAAPRTAAPSWLAPQGFDEDEGSSASEYPLAMDADAAHRAPMRAAMLESAVDEAHPAPARVSDSLMPPPSPVISVLPEAPPAYPDLREENAELRRALAALMGELSRVRKDVREASEAELVRLACTVAERVVGEELSIDPGHIIEWAREGIDALDSKENVVVAIASDLGQVLPSEEWNELGPNVTVEIDPALAPSSCEVRSRTGVAKVSASARMGQLKTELGVEEER